MRLSLNTNLARGGLVSEETVVLCRWAVVQDLTYCKYMKIMYVNCG